MKNKVTVLVFSLFGFIQMLYGQVTEAESKLRSNDGDTSSGWKKGAIIGLSLSQASFTNWSSGGQNSFSVNGLFSVYVNYKKGKT